MHETLHIPDITVFFSAFLAGSILIHILTKRLKLPYTITIFCIGLLLQSIESALPFPINFNLSTDVIFFILLPFLLFESALHIKFHQFRLQFKTISFISTFGLLFSIFTIGLLLPLVIGIPLPIALLFGAIISATDPVAVLALFKTLPVPKRLALLVDGESMFNDGTGVIAFKLVSTFVVGGTAFSSGKLAGSFGNFVYVFFGAMLLGIVLGYFTSKIIGLVRRDIVASTTITVGAALGSFVLAEHFLHMSGVITTVLTGVVVGNLGSVKISYQVRNFIEEMWDYISFLANTLVFFFIGYIFNLGEFFLNPIFYISAVGVVLIGRVATTYISFFITNRMPGFKNEPNVPLKWQHLINWGGLRATIPILLIFTLPNSFEYKELLTNLTLATVLFTLMVNGTTSAWLLKKLNLHLPKKDEKIIDYELAIFQAEDTKNKIQALRSKGFNPLHLKAIQKEIQKKEEVQRNKLIKLADPDAFALSLKRYSLAIERNKLEELLENNWITENAYLEFETELDLQGDVVEYQQLKNININSQKSYRKRLLKAKVIANNFPLLNSIFGTSPEDLIINRYQLLQARILTSEDVFSYFEKVKELIKDKKLNEKLNEMIATHEGYVARNKTELIELEKNHKKLIDGYQYKIINYIVA